MNNLKRILTIALCSVLVVCTVPQFSIRSEAASTATYALYQTLLNLSGYLTTRGYSIAHEYGSSIPSITELQTMTYENLGQRLFDISLKLNAFGATHDVPDLGEQFINAMSEASFRGSILLSKSTRDLIDLWLETSNSNGSVIIGSSPISISDFVYSSGHEFIYDDGDAFRNVSMDCPGLILAYNVNNSVYNAFYIPENLDDFVYDALRDIYVPPYLINSGTFSYTSSFVIDNKTYNVQSLLGMSFSTQSYLNSNVAFVTGSRDRDVLANYYAGQYDSLGTSNTVVSQITDTSNSDLLTSTNTIDSTGEVEGTTTIYLPDQSTLENAIDQYNQNAISYEDFLKALGINSVASDASVQEKEEALTVVVTPSEDYLWFTKTQWGADSIEETRKASASTRAEEDSLANSIANTLNGGSDPEPDDDGKSRGKGLLALLLLGLGIWNTPIIAGDGTPSSGGTDDGSTDGSGDTSGYLQQSIAGMAVAGGIVEDLFSAAGGSNGYGLAYTVGASFVIFSVIIGAANYFGALFSGSDTKQNIKSSGKQTRSKSPSPKSKKGG